MTVLNLDRNVLLVAFSFYFIVYTPFMIYCLVQLWYHRKKVFMQKHHIRLLVISVFSTIILTTRSVIFDSNACAISIICDRTISIQSHDIMEHLFLIPLIFSFTLRCWLLYYDLRWNAIMANLEWWRHINDTQINNNWILKYKNTLGSLNKSMWKYLCLYCICYVTTNIILSCYYPDIADALSSLHILGSLIISDIILCKIPLYDAFQIRFELNVVLSVWTVACLYFGITESQDFISKYAFFAYAKGWVNIAFSMMIGYMTILYPIWYFCRISKEPITVQNRSDNKQQVSLWTDYAFSTSDAFNNFMQHLIKEMAMENLCFLLEVFQLKEKYLNDGISNDKIGYFLRLPSDLPQSSILEGTKDLRQQIILLYNKYIIDSAELAINISYDTMQEIKKSVNTAENKHTHSNNDIGDMLLIYDEAALEIQQLLTHSYIRFQVLLAPH